MILVGRASPPSGAGLCACHPPIFLRLSFAPLRLCVTFIFFKTGVTCAIDLGKNRANGLRSGIRRHSHSRLSLDEAVRVLRRALEQGRRPFTIPPICLWTAKRKIGQAWTGLRPRVILASKTLKRDRQGAREDLELSLRRLRTDYLRTLSTSHGLPGDGFSDDYWPQWGAGGDGGRGPKARSDPAPRSGLA